MSNTKFGELISFFKKNELEEILKMGSKKMNGMFTDSISVLEAICKKYAAIKLKQFDMDWIQKNCAKNQSENQWRNTQRNLTEAFHQYIRLKKISHSLDQDFELLDFFKEHELKINYRRLVDNIRKKLDTYPISFNRDYYKFRLREHQLELSKGKKRRKKVDNLDDLNDDLVQFYYINKLKIILAKANRSHVIANINIKDQENFIKQIPPQYANLTTISILIDSYKMLKEKDIKYYYQLKKTAITEKEMSFVFRNYIFSFLLNFIIRRYNTGIAEIQNEYFNLIEIMEGFNMFSQNGEVSRKRIKNVATLAVRADKIDWLNNFLKKCRKERIKSTSRDAVLRYADCLVLFYEKKYAKTIKILESFQPLDESLKVNKDVLLIKSYFVLNEDDLFDKKTETLRRKLNKDQTLPKKEKEVRKDFVKFIIPVFNNRKYRYKLITIKTKLKKYRYFAEKEWIIEQIDQCINK